MEMLKLFAPGRAILCCPQHTAQRARATAARIHMTGRAGTGAAAIGVNARHRIRFGRLHQRTAGFYLNFASACIVCNEGDTYHCGDARVIGSKRQ